MPQSLVKINLHIVFSTKNRYDWIDNQISGEVYSYLSTICIENGCLVHNIGGTENHMHIACTLPRVLTISSLLENLKSSSSKWIKTKGLQYRDFAWQKGYAAFSIGQSQVNTLIRYIDNQHEHHRKKKFEKELIGLLNVHNVSYDEKYLWN